MTIFFIYKKSSFVRFCYQNKTNFIIDSAKKFNEEIFNEDKEICESIHQNLQNGNKYSNIGKFEQRINFFRKKLIDNKIE